MDDDSRGADDTGGRPSHDHQAGESRAPGKHLRGTPASSPGRTPPADDRTARWEQRTELLLAVAALAFLAAYALRVLGHDLADGLLDLCLAVTLAAWAVFAVDYAVRWRLSGQRLRFVRTHWLDTLVLLLPLLRPLRVVKVYEAVQRRRGQPGSPCTRA